MILEAFLLSNLDAYNSIFQTKFLLAAVSYRRFIPNLICIYLCFRICQAHFECSLILVFYCTNNEVLSMSFHVNIR